MNRMPPSPRRSTVARQRALAACCCAATLLGCASPEPRIFDVPVEVTREDGKQPVAGAVVRAADATAVTTDARGRSLLHVRGQAGDRVPVTLTCPAGSRASPDAELTLPGAPSANPDDAPALRLACALTTHDAVVLVHASGSTASLPVKIDGEVVGQTDALGFAHVHVRAGPRAEFEVSLDTSANPALAPANPAQQFLIDRADELFVFDTAFVPGPRKARRPANQRRRPVEALD